MKRASLFWPISIILAGLMALGVSFAAAPAQVLTRPVVQEQPYAAPCENGSSAYPVCATQTAEAGSQPTNPPATATATVTTTATSGVTATAVLTATQAPTNGPTRTLATPTFTPSPTLEPGAEVLTCAPGLPVQIEGTGPVDTPLLLFFNQRAVGGTLSDLSGFYSMSLIVGDERGGDYPVEVQVRGTRDIVRELICRVPNGSPSPDGTPTGEGSPSPEATPANLDRPTSTPTLPPQG